MRLLVTRPEPDASRTAELLRQRGHEPVLAPMMIAHHLPPPADLAAILPSAILFTSANGPRALAGWPIPAGWRNVPVLTVGDRTAEAARQAGFSTVSSAAGDADALAAHLRSNGDPSAGSLVHVTGVDRSVDLAGALTADGFRVRTIEAYDMPATTALPEPVIEALAGGKIDGALFYSRRTAEIFRRLLQDANLTPVLQRLRLFALSDTVASVFAPATVAVAERLDEPALLALLPHSEGTVRPSLR